MTVYDYNFFHWHSHPVGKKYIFLKRQFVNCKLQIACLPTKRIGVHINSFKPVRALHIEQIMLLKNSVLKVSEQKKNTMIDDTVILSLDNQTRPIYPLVDLSSSTIIILVTIIKYALLYCTWPKLFVFPLIISIA